MNIIDEILGAILAALLVTLAVLLVVNANLRAEVATLRADTSTLGSANAALKEEVDRQNRAVIALQSAEEKRALLASQAIKSADAEAKHYAAEASRIEKQNPASANDCAAAQQVLRDYLKVKK